MDRDDQTRKAAAQQSQGTASGTGADDDAEATPITGNAPGAYSGGALDDTTTASVGSSAMGGLSGGNSMGSSAVNDMSGAAMGSGSRHSSTLDNAGNAAVEDLNGRVTEDGVAAGRPDSDALNDDRQGDTPNT
jgi:hypothetical protein